MLVIEVAEFGGPDVLRPVQRPDPVAGRGKVLVRVAACDVLFLDTMLRGRAVDAFPIKLPWVPGNGIAGRLLGGPGDGRAVVAHTGNRGGYAEQAAVLMTELTAVPDGVGLDTAAALLHDGPTALALLDRIDVRPGKTVLVVGASGGLGVALVQLCRARGIRVVATARGAAKVDRVRAVLGPAGVIDSGRDDWVEQARALLGDGADVVLDNVGGDLGTAAFALVRPGGRFSAHGTPSGRFATVPRTDITVTGIEQVQLDPPTMWHYTEQALKQAAAGVLDPIIGQRFALADAAAAHAAIEGREVFGKTLLIADTP
jgi:NADPH2:quinone reductase